MLVGHLLLYHPKEYGVCQVGNLFFSYLYDPEFEWSPSYWFPELWILTKHEVRTKIYSRKEMPNANNMSSSDIGRFPFWVLFGYIHELRIYMIKWAPSFLSFKPCSYSWGTNSISEKLYYIMSCTILDHLSQFLPYLSHWFSCNENCINLRCWLQFSMIYLASNIWQISMFGDTIMLYAAGHIKVVVNGSDWSFTCIFCFIVGEH